MLLAASFAYPAAAGPTEGVGSVSLERAESIVGPDSATQTDVHGSFRDNDTARASRNGEGIASSVSGDRSADPDDSVFLVCYRGRERSIPDYRLAQYLDSHPGSYVGHCEEVTKASR